MAPYGMTVIVQLIAEGKSTKEIAFLLKVSVKTVEAHRAQLMARLDIHDVAGLVRYAMRVGLVPLGRAAPRPSGRRLTKVFSPADSGIA